MGKCFIRENIFILSLVLTRPHALQVASRLCAESGQSRCYAGLLPRSLAVLTDADPGQPSGPLGIACNRDLTLITGNDVKTQMQATCRQICAYPLWPLDQAKMIGHKFLKAYFLGLKGVIDAEKVKMSDFDRCLIGLRGL